MPQRHTKMRLIPRGAQTAINQSDMFNLATQNGFAFLEDESSQPITIDLSGKKSVRG